ncbi:hypothetical protein AGMMS49982_18610 [Bacteroidia bacterium]|nr:hypothetical protein AGMMS49982_18610 [Bacteroidia bacterium]
MKQYVTTFSWETKKVNTLGIRSDEGVPFSVEWGDGVETQYVGDLTSQTELEGMQLLHCYSADGVATVTIEGPIKALSLTCQHVAIDSTQNPAFEGIYCDCDSIDTSKNPTLKFLWTEGQLTTLNVTHNCLLTELYCWSTQLTALDVSQNAALTNLNCSNNQLTTLNVSQNVALTELYCADNQLTTLDVSQNAALIHLNCSNNQLTALEVSGNNLLTGLNCGENQLTALDVSGNNLLTDLHCWKNQLTALDVSHNVALTTLNCENNQLTALDVSHNVALTTLHCGSNQLTVLDVSHNVALTVLYCSKNQLTALDVSHNNLLKKLGCWENQLTAIDVSRNAVLSLRLHGKNFEYQCKPSDEEAVRKTAMMVDSKILEYAGHSTENLLRLETFHFAFKQFENAPAPSIIKVVGVGGGGSNVVNHIHSKGIEGVSFALCNAEASASEIKNMLSDGTKMVIIVACMGGGTGTSTAPVIAKIAKEMGLSTIGIVSTPFAFEGNPAMSRALKGVEEMKKNADSIFLLNNALLGSVYPGLSVAETFKRADDMLATMVKSIAEIITIDGYQNIDFRDVKTTLENGGVAILNSGFGEGKQRVYKAFNDAINSPLLNNKDVFTAKKILFNIYSGSEKSLQMSELDEIRDFLLKFDKNIHVIFGLAKDESLGDKIKVTVIASGFS